MKSSKRYTVKQSDEQEWIWIFHTSESGVIRKKREILKEQLEK